MKTKLSKMISKTAVGIVTSLMLFSPQMVAAEESNDEYKEIWRDDFDQGELNMEDWGYELGSIRGIENQHYVKEPENIFFRDDNLILRITDRAEEDQYNNPRGEDRRVIYNSGSIRTHGKREFLYGKLEIRARMPKGQGAFPAFWTLGADFTLDGRIAEDQGHHWPASGEIDITELIGQDEDGALGNRSVYQTIHYGPEHDVSSGKFTGNGTRYSLPSGNFNDDYHTFGFNWTETEMEWYVDDKVVRRVPYAEDPLAKDIFNKPQYIQLNLAAGGAWPGPAGDNLDGTEFQIDYVSFSQTDEQREAAAEYYASAPTIENIEPLEMLEGELINPVENITTIEGYEVDFSIEDEPMFIPTGGNTNVELLVSGVNELDKISELPAGTYNLHYSAVPKGVDLAKSPEAKVARKTTTLVINPKTQKQGWVKEGATWYYYVNGTVQTGWQKVNGTWYYMDTEGAMQTGWQKVNGTWYYMNPSGAMQTGWHKVSGTWYYMNLSGAMQTGWHKVSGTWYYMNSSGAMQTGWHKVSGTWYYMNSSGAMQTGWHKVDGTWYYMNSNGAMQTGWHKVDGTWYYMNSSGAMQTGWLKLGGSWYYMNSSGAMQTGWQKINGSWYYLDGNGVWQR